MLRNRARRVLTIALGMPLALGVAACGSTAGTDSGADAGKGSGPLVVASINAWGSILAQLGGTHVRAGSIITKSGADPHSYEPTPSDGRRLATARMVVVNGVGYDAWANKLLAANPDSTRVVVDAGELAGARPGDNPHRWYSPSDVEKVADAITANLKTIDAPSAAYFDEQRRMFEVQGLARYHSLIAGIRAGYTGTPIGASESIVDLLAQALGLQVLTPQSFLRAVSEGAEPSTADKATVDAQIATKAIKVYVYNTQNSTPDVNSQVKAAKAEGIPVIGVTETLMPPAVGFQDWQSAQLTELQAALRQGTGR